MAFVVKEVTTGPSAVVASNTTPSEADSQDDLERLNARGDSWLHSVEERELTEESISRKYKGRTIFSAEQLRVLQQRFQLQRYLTASEQQELGNAIGLTSQQVKTWFQNRRMKVKRLLKEPTASTQISFLQADLSQNNSVVYGKPMDNMKQQFTSYSLSHLLPRHLVPSPDKHWPSAGPVYPNLGKFQSTVIKSELQYTNQSVNFSIKKEAIALSSRPELKQMKLPATSYSHTIPVQHFDFSLQQALPGPPYLQQGLPYEVIKPAGDELHHEKVIIS
ncbi:homeobox protein HMX3-like isoform X3 [Rhincodon typus]|nr:homeobox protein HMX3-like isoform X3 [Rhincodon typus]